MNTIFGSKDGENTLNIRGGLRFLRYRILLNALIVGIICGLIVTAYKYALDGLKTASKFLYGAVSQNPSFLPLVFLSLTGLALLTAWLVKVEPLAMGGGIPQVKAQIDDDLRVVSWRIAVVKFFGGALAMFCGLGLGREGPSVQLGAATGEGYAAATKTSDRERKFLILCGAGAGLAAAFNAPLAGAILSLEELRKDFNPRVLLAALISSIAATITANLLDGAVYSAFSITAYNLPLSMYGYVLIAALLLGLFGPLYNKLLLFCTDRLNKLKIPRFYKFLPAFFAAGLLCIFLPVLAYDGHPLLDSLIEHPGGDGIICGLSGIGALSVIFIIHFVFSIISFSSGAPGGNFFPVMVSGAIIGAFVGVLFADYMTLDSTYIINFILLGMAGALTAVVRAPITAIILVLELTGSFSHLLPFALTAMVTFVIADLLNSPPIYDSMLERLRERLKNADSSSSQSHTRD